MVELLNDRNLEEDRRDEFMKKQIWKRFTAAGLAAILAFSGNGTIAFADGSQVVTIGADLTTEQKNKMFEYFGVSEDEVAVIEVNNKEEREYLEGIATEAEIGTRTYSCSYIMPTDADVINVKTANLTWVSTSMIANTLVTAGIKSCDVVAAAPFEVSGTGALTGIIKSYENATDETLDEEKKELAMEELYETGELADEIGKDEAAAVMNEMKAQVIESGEVDKEKIKDILNEVSEYYDVTVPEENAEQVVSLMSKIGEQGYDYSVIENTMDDLQDKLVEDLGTVSESLKDKLAKEKEGIFQKIGNFFAGIAKAIVNFFKGLFGGNKEVPEIDPNSILNNVNDSVLGGDSSDDEKETSEPKEDSEQKETSGAEDKNPEDAEENKTETEDTLKIDTSNTETPANNEIPTPTETPEESVENPSENDNALGAEEKVESINTAE